ncbi:MAG: DUF6056 family protein [Faecalibacterium sp.]
MKQQTLKNALEKLRKEGYLPYLALFCIMLGLHLQFTLGTGDDPMNKELLQNYNLFLRLAEMYQIWSARQLVDAVMYLFSALPYWVWRVVNPIVLTLCTYFAARLLQIERKPTFAWSLVGLVLCYQWANLTSAGWVCTTLGFLWPLTAGLYAMQPYVNLLRGQATPKWQYIVSFVLFLYAVNMEQFMVVVFILLLVLVVGLRIAKRKIHWYLPAQLAMCGVALLYFATCPGVTARMLNEMATSFIDFQMRTLLQKIELGLSNGFAHLMYQTNYLFFLLCLLVFLCIWRQYQSKLYRLMAAVPLAFVTVLGLFSAQSCALFPKLTFFQHALTSTGMITVANAGTPKRYIAFLLLCVLFSLCIVNIYLAFGHSIDAIVGVSLLCAGFSSHAMMGFSTSIWSSGDRTAFFCSMSLIAICVLLCMRCLPPKTKTWTVAQGAIWICAVVQCISLIGA